MTLRSEAEARDYVESLADRESVERLDALAGALLDENRRQNLISRSSESDLWVRHIADSAQLLRFVPRGTWPDPWLDLGSGAGFPGLIVAALNPQAPVILVESRSRRVEWLVRMTEELSLQSCRVIGSRLELVDPFETGVVSARAFAPLPKLLRLSAPFSTKRTVYVLPKGRRAAQELSELPAKVRCMFHVEQSLTDADAGIIVSANAKDRKKG